MTVANIQDSPNYEDVWRLLQKILERYLEGQPVTPAIPIELSAPEYDHSSNMWDQKKGLHLMSPTVHKVDACETSKIKATCTISLNRIPVSISLWLSNFLGQRCIQESSESFSSVSLQNLPFTAQEPLETYSKDFCRLPTHELKDHFWSSPASIIWPTPIHPHNFTDLRYLFHSLKKPVSTRLRVGLDNL